MREKASDAFGATTGAELREVRQWQSIFFTNHTGEGVSSGGAGRQAGQLQKSREGKVISVRLMKRIETGGCRSSWDRGNEQD